MNTARPLGFTLIELLVVIAIIAILAGMVSVALPKALEKARIADVQADFRVISTALTQYFAENQSYPPAYGFRNPPAAAPPVNILETHLGTMSMFGALDYYDRFSEGFGYDTNNNKRIERLEWQPYSPGADELVLADTVLYDGSLTNPTGRLKKEPRPYVYAPYFSKQMDKLKRTVGEGNIWPGELWDENFESTLGYPPPRYDGFVLVSIGPEANTHGVVVPYPDEDAFVASVEAATDAADIYNVLALRTAYLGSRDVNKNGRLDFDFIARSRQDEADPAAYTDPEFRRLPDRTFAGGPMLHHQAP